MLNGKYISIDRILDKVYMDNGYREELDWTQAIEWIADALDLIGAKQSYFSKVALIEIEDFSGAIPCDYHQNIMIREGVNKTPMLESSDEFIVNYRNNQTACCTTAGNPALSPDVSVNTGEFPIDSNGYPILPDDVDYLRSKARNSSYYYYTTLANQPSTEILSYSIRNNVIYTSFETGCIEMSYSAFPVDDKGYPMIPDDQAFIEAVSAYLRYKIDYLLWRAGELRDAVWQHTQQEWLWYVGKAGAKANVPSLDKMEAMKNQWLRLVPKINEHSGSFKYLNHPEERYKY